MTVKLEHLLLMVGGILLLIGAVLGIMPVKAGGVSCGTALTGVSDDAAVADFTSAMMGRGSMDNRGACEDAVSGRRVPTFALGIPGLVLLGAGGVMVSRARADASAATDVGSTSSHGGR